MLAAQTVMIPTLQVCNLGKVSGSAQVYLSRRDDVPSGDISVTQF